jgi:membrane-bound serine protease (ClpP class)
VKIAPRSLFVIIFAFCIAMTGTLRAQPITPLRGQANFLRADSSTTSFHLHEAKIVAVPVSLRERLLRKLTNPNFAILFVALGSLLIYLEFNLPGSIIPGTFGAFLVLLGGFGLSLSPLNHSALLLILAAFVMIGLEVSVYSHGILAFVGTIFLVLGLATLTDNTIPELKVRFAIALAVGLGFSTISVGLGWIALRARRNKVLISSQAMIGNLAVTRTPLSPTGQVEVRGELWQASLEGTPELPTGATVRIRAITGLQLIVEPTLIIQTGSPRSSPTAGLASKVN